MSRRRRVLLWLAVPALVAALIAAAAVLLLRSARFHEYVRQRIVQEVERATGGKTSLDSFSFDWRRMRAEVRGFVLRGREEAGQPPLFRATSITAGFHIQSLYPRKIHLALIEIDDPALNVQVDSEGRSNFPRPAVSRTGGRKPLELFVDLAARQLRLRQGWFRYNSRSIPLDVEARDFSLRLFYEHAAKRYSGDAACSDLQAASGTFLLPLRFGANVTVAVERNRIGITRAVLRMPSSKLDVTGSVDLLAAPAARIFASGDVALRDVGAALRLPVEHRGSVRLDGEFLLGGGRPFSASGFARAEGVAVLRHPVVVRDIAASARWRISRAGAELDDLAASALGGRFLGRASIPRFSTYHAEGRIEDLPAENVARAIQMENPPWSAAISGPVEVSGNFRSRPRLEFSASAGLALSRAAGGLPLDGELHFQYDYRASELQFGLSHLRTDSTRLTLRGDVNRRLEVGLFCRRLEDLMPAFEMAGFDAARLPLRLRGGVVQFDGTVSGVLGGETPESPRRPMVRGRLSGQSVEIAGRAIDKATLRIEASPDRVSIAGLSLRQGDLRIEGGGSAALESWRIAARSRIEGRFTAYALPLERLLREAGASIPVTGILSGSFGVDGTYADPRVEARISVVKPAAWEETFDRLTAELHIGGGAVEVKSARFEKGPAAATLSGSYRYQAGRWDSGRMEMEVSGTRFQLTSIRAVQRYRKRIDGTLAWRLHAVLRLEGGSPALDALDGELSVHNIELDKRPLGRLRLDSLTSGRLMTVTLESRMVDSLIRGRAEWSLSRNSNGLGQLQVERMTFATMQDLGLLGDPDKPLLFEGFVEGELGFSGPVLRPASWTAAAKITRFEISPSMESATTRLSGAASEPGLAIRNQEPLLAYITSQGVTVQPSRIVSRYTDMEAEGTVAFRSRNPWNLRLRGTVQLPVLSVFQPDLVASGVSTVDAVIRGSLMQPQITGRLELKDASIALRDAPNGIEKATGVIVFDRSRATIESLTAQTGGGDLDLSGFVGFGGPELVYRLQARAQRVRVRYPSSVSTTFNADLSLTGTSSRSLLDGELTVTRMGINPRTDFGSMLLESSRTRPTQITSSQFLRGMQLNVRVRTSGDAELLTSLTRDVQPDASLELRGSGARPNLLGRVTVNQGEIQFFGNRYTIARGEVSFYNPVTVEPVLDVDLETRVRGITVTINLSGAFNKLNVSYRSDPPLQSAEIVALLTVGRAPGSAAGSPNTAGTQSAGYLQAGGNSLLGQAVATPISGRLQRFFGVSRLKIDPELTGVSNTPQARVTIEQQLSRDITVTYITGLNRSQQQIVRLQWDFSKDFSVLAVREENGVFGVDFQYRRRFK